MYIPNLHYLGKPVGGWQTEQGHYGGVLSFFFFFRFIFILCYSTLCCFSLFSVRHGFTINSYFVVLGDKDPAWAWLETNRAEQEQKGVGIRTHYGIMAEGIYCWGRRDEAGRSDEKRKTKKKREGGTRVDRSRAKHSRKSRGACMSTRRISSCWTGRTRERRPEVSGRIGHGRPIPVIPLGKKFRS